MSSNDDIAAPTHDDRPDYHMRLGEVIRAWADLEHSLMGIVASLLGVDQFRARIVLASVGQSRQQREFALRLAETYMDETLLPRFRAIMRRAKKFSSDRNLLAHAMMHISVDNEECLAFRDVFPTSEKGALAFEAIPLQLNRLTTLRDSISEVRGDLQRFQFDLLGHVHTSAKIHREQQSHPSQ